MGGLEGWEAQHPATQAAYAARDWGAAEPPAACQDDQGPQGGLVRLMARQDITR